MPVRIVPLRPEHSPPPRPDVCVAVYVGAQTGQRHDIACTRSRTGARAGAADLTPSEEGTGARSACCLSTAPLASLSAASSARSVNTRRVCPSSAARSSTRASSPSSTIPSCLRGTPSSITPLSALQRCPPPMTRPPPRLLSAAYPNAKRRRVHPGPRRRPPQEAVSPMPHTHSQDPPTIAGELGSGKGSVLWRIAWLIAPKGDPALHELAPDRRGRTRRRRFRLGSGLRLPSRRRSRTEVEPQSAAPGVLAEDAVPAGGGDDAE
jgi:hypothetical protein